MSIRSYCLWVGDTASPIQLRKRVIVETTTLTAAVMQESIDWRRRPA